MGWWKQPSTIHVLSECCICRTSASVTFPALRTLCQGEFAGLEEERLILNVFPDESPASQVDSLCCVTFNYEYRPHVFLTSVIDYGEARGTQPRRLVLERPARILDDKRRIAFRVPVQNYSGLQVRVKTEGGQTWVPMAKNVSVAGMLVAFDPANDPGLAIGDMVEVVLQLGDHKVYVQAEIKRGNGGSYGLFFPTVVSGRRLRPPPELDGIVRALDRQRIERAAGRRPKPDSVPAPAASRR